VLITYRKSGEPVPTPIWFGVTADGRAVYVRTEARSGKVKRIRNDPRVRLAPSTLRGKPLGPPLEGRARIVPEAEEEQAERVIAANYGRFRKIYEGMPSGAELVYVEIEPGSGESEPGSGEAEPTV